MNNITSTSQKLNALKSENFNKSVNSAVTAIILFILSYVFLIGLAIGLAIICGLAGYVIIAIGFHFLTIVLSLGIVCLGAMVLLFTIKFLFVSNKDVNPHRVQLFEKDHPKLFALIREIATETGTSFPKKIFVSHQVNACVFYNSGFWSLFFPIRKNLEIGLGLISCVNEAELKAIIAHEFGHFTQSSMRVGNYVYRVNNIIFSMVNSHDKWDDLLISWANTGGVFAWFAVFTSHIANFIRKLLAKAYQPINIRYLALSKEMEFHADLVAANVAGKSTSISALRRIEFGAMMFDDLVNKLGELGGEEKRTDNLFSSFKIFLKYRAQKNNFELENDLPIIDDKSYVQNIVHRRVTYKDKWSSHPNLKERVTNILTADVEYENTYTNPWNLFENATSLQCQITAQLYTLGFPDKSLSVIPQEEVQEALIMQSKSHNLHEYFRFFYLNRSLSKLDLDSLSSHQQSNGNFDEIYSTKFEEQLNCFYRDSNDLTILKSIKEGHIIADEFEFDDKNYSFNQVDDVIAELQKEIDQQTDYFNKKDEQAFLYNYKIALSESAEKAAAYKKLYNNLQNAEQEENTYRTLTARFYAYSAYLSSFNYLSDEVSKSACDELNEMIHILKTNVEVSKQTSIFTVGEIDLTEGYSNYLLQDKPTVSSALNEFNAHVYNETFETTNSIFEKVSKVKLEAECMLLEFQMELVNEKATL